MKTIGFIGLGAMGKPMARRLLVNGFDVRSCANVRREAIEELKADGLSEVTSPREVSDGADAVIVMVRDDQQADAVVSGEDGALAAMSPGSILVLMSTLAPGYCIELCERSKEKGIAVLDAPVSGLPVRAEQGTLTLMVGGDQAAVGRFRPVFEAMGTIFPCGDVGMGMVAKLANNLTAIGAVALVSEATKLAAAYGMETAKLLEIISQSTGDSFTVRNWDLVKTLWPDMKDLAIKDLKLCSDVGAERGVAMPLAQTASRYLWGQMF